MLCSLRYQLLYGSSTCAVLSGPHMPGQSAPVALHVAQALNEGDVVCSGSGGVCRAAREGGLAAREVFLKLLRLGAKPVALPAQHLQHAVVVALCVPVIASHCMHAREESLTLSRCQVADDSGCVRTYAWRVELHCGSQLPCSA